MDPRSLIKSAADQCVKCGLCLPHCPTYRKTGDEGDSPRGRIALMQALADDLLPAQGRLAFHLDRCLACRACERVCPSGVRYGLLIDNARVVLARSSRRVDRLGTLLRALVARPGRLRLAGALWRFAEACGLRRLARSSGLLRSLALIRMDRLLPDLPRRPQRRRDYYPAVGPERGRVALFTGCMTDLFAPETLDASIRLLTRAGYGVHIPRGQGCCGALHLHAGDADGAADLAQRNGSAFAGLAVDAVLYTASGCGTTLAEYPAGASPPFPAPVQDVVHFLAAIEWPHDLRLAPASTRVAVQDPCLQRNVLRDDSSAYRLLERIPGLAVAPLAGNDQCCGAAGAYMLEQPELSDALRADKLAAIGQADVVAVVTTNIGCALHLAAGLRAGGSRVEVLHPVVLLARHLAEDGDATAATGGVETIP